MDLVVLATDVIKVLLVYGILLNAGGLLTWVERKQSAVIQHRVGANRAGFQLPRRLEGRGEVLNPLLLVLAPVLNPLLRVITKLGLLHALADGGKMLFKEDFAPANANRFLYQIAPLLAVVPAFLVSVIIPFGPPITVFGREVTMQIASLDVGILFFFAVGGVGVYSAAIGGWASGNKFSLLGSVRASAQMISYEIAYGLALVGLLMTFQTLRPEELVAAQGQMLFGVIPMWGIVVQPLGFLLFYAAMLAEGKRVPFDLPEGESELVAGYFLEYSGMKFGTFYLAEFVEVFVHAALMTTLFFGGWQVPFLYDQGFVLPLVGTLELPGWLVTLTRTLSFWAKVLFFCWLNVQIRWTLLRFRFDQLIGLGWKIMLPLALANIVVTGIVLVL